MKVCPTGQEFLLVIDTGFIDPDIHPVVVCPPDAINSRNNGQCKNITLVIDINKAAFDSIDQPIQEEGKKEKSHHIVDHFFLAYNEFTVFV